MIHWIAETKPKVLRKNYGGVAFPHWRWKVENHPTGVKSFSTWKQAIRYALKRPLVTQIHAGVGGTGGGGGASWPPIGNRLTDIRWQSVSYPSLLDSPSIGVRFRQLPTDDEPLADYTMDHEGHMTPLSERATTWDTEQRSAQIDADNSRFC